MVKTSTAALNLATLRVLTVLDAVGARPDAVGVSELSRELGLSKNMVHRALATLVDEGFVTRDATGVRYDLGPGILDLHGPQWPAPELRTIARPFLEALHDVTGESVFLSIIVGRNRVNIDGIEARGRRVTNLHGGKDVPLHVTVPSRVLLAYLPATERAEYLATIGDADVAERVRADLVAIRERGYAAGAGETIDAVFIAHPVLDGAGHPLAAIVIGGPADRFPIAHAVAFAPEIERVAREVAIRAVTIA